jgi:hypothetical protein
MIGDIFSSAFAWLWGRVLYLVDSFYNFFLGENGWVWWVVIQSLDLLSYGFDLLSDYSLGTFLSSYTSESQLFFSVIVFADLFFPLSELLVLIQFFVLFVILFIVLKLIFKAIPTVG